MRISKQEDEAGVSQVMVECSHMLFPRLQCKQSLHYKTVSPTLSLYQGICINLHFSLTSGPLAQLQHARYGCISKITSTGMTGMPRITRMTSVRGLRAQRCGDSVTVIMDYIHAS